MFDFMTEVSRYALPPAAYSSSSGRWLARPPIGPDTAATDTHIHNCSQQHGGQKPTSVLLSSTTHFGYD